MDEVQITVRPNGPYLLRGKAAIVDADGNAFETTGDVVALCRCGGSTTKPFCDGAHSKIGFVAATKAVVESEDASGVTTE